MDEGIVFVFFAGSSRAGFATEAGGYPDVSGVWLTGGIRSTGADDAGGSLQSAGICGRRFHRNGAAGIYNVEQRKHWCGGWMFFSCEWTDAGILGKSCTAVLWDASLRSVLPGVFLVGKDKGKEEYGKADSTISSVCSIAGHLAGGMGNRWNHWLSQHR